MENYYEQIENDMIFNEDDKDLSLFELPLIKRKKKKEENKNILNTDDYKIMLNRIYKLLEQHKTSIIKQKFVIPPPQIYQIARKSIWTNFHKISKILQRDINHINSFLIIELRTNCFMNDNNLVIYGKYFQKHIESILKKYIKEYVICSNCKNFNTFLITNNKNKLHMLKCISCDSTFYVNKIKKLK